MNDADTIRDVARAVATMAQDMRTESTRVADRSTVHWSGSAAAQYHSKLRECAADYMRLWGDLERLHDALLSHARHVEDHESFVGSLLQGVNPLKILTPGVSW